MVHKKLGREAGVVVFICQDWGRVAKIKGLPVFFLNCPLEIYIRSDT